MTDFFNTLKQGVGKGMTTMSIKSKEMLDSTRVRSMLPFIKAPSSITTLTE